VALNFDQMMSAVTPIADIRELIYANRKTASRRSLLSPIRYFCLVVLSAVTRQPMEENIMLIVSDETHDRTAAESVRPSSENRHKPARSGEMLESVVARVRSRVVDIGVS
jgi:hypothetical protein